MRICGVLKLRQIVPNIYEQMDINGKDIKILIEQFSKNYTKLDTYSPYELDLWIIIPGKDIQGNKFDRTSAEFLVKNHKNKLLVELKHVIEEYPRDFFLDKKYGIKSNSTKDEIYKTLEIDENLITFCVDKWKEITECINTVSRDSLQKINEDLWIQPYRYQEPKAKGKLLQWWQITDEDGIIVHWKPSGPETRDRKYPIIQADWSEETIVKTLGNLISENQRFFLNPITKTVKLSQERDSESYRYHNSLTYFVDKLKFERRGSLFETFLFGIKDKTEQIRPTNTTIVISSGSLSFGNPLSQEEFHKLLLHLKLDSISAGDNFKRQVYIFAHVTPEETQETITAVFQNLIERNSSIHCTEIPTLAVLDNKTVQEKPKVVNITNLSLSDRLASIIDEMPEPSLEESI